MSEQLDNNPRERCYQCFRPRSLCFCDEIPRIDNQTDVLILQHIGERFHPFNTARIVQIALRRCRLIVDHNRRLGARSLPIQAGAGLLYPQANAPLLDDLPKADRPSQLVIIDGTWHQAKTIVRDVRQLHALPCYRLAPSSPGQYRIRREPDAESLSTLEATVAALQALEPETAGLDRLLSAFHTMVDTQLKHPASHEAWRRKKSRESHPRYIPNALLDNPEHLVVAYGESAPGRRGEPRDASLPVTWVARRLGTLDHFSCRILPPTPLSDTAMHHMRLSKADFDDAVSQETFRQRWKQFIQPHDVLIVYHHRTSQLLANINALLPQYLVLKSIFGKLRNDFHSLEELAELEEVPLPTFEKTSRAMERLSISVALTEHLRQRYRT